MYTLFIVYQKITEETDDYHQKTYNLSGGLFYFTFLPEKRIDSNCVVHFYLAAATIEACNKNTTCEWRQDNNNNDYGDFLNLGKMTSLAWDVDHNNDYRNC